jgi:plastocyanin
MYKTLRLFPLVAALSLLVPALASASVATVTMQSDNTFSPQSVSIYQGDTVTWVNQSNMVQTATADSGLFDSGPIQPGQQFSATFGKTGIFAYHSTYNGNLNGVGMSGTVVVNAAGNTGTYANPNSNYYNGAPPVYTGAPAGTAQLYAQVQSLLAQIQALQAQGAGGAVGTPTVTYNSSSCPLVGRSLKVGSSGDDVTRLQQFLARDPSVYPEGQVTGYFGALTQAAVQRWQTKYNIVSSGSPDTTGFGVVGPRTAAAMSQLCTTGSVNGVSGGSVVQGGGAPVGGFIQVTPVSGAAPLTVNVTATINTGGSCASATYTLDFGDGTVPQQIPTSGCSQQSQTYQHSYIYGGVYQVTLSAGAHRTSASVSVSGPSAPPGTTIGIPTNGTIGQARGTISAFTTSGNVPLNVTFYVSCAAGTAYNVNFGDGTDLGGTAVSSTKCGTGALDAISHTFTQTGTFQVQLIIFSQQSNGTITPTTAGTVSISVGSVANSYSYNPPQLTQGSTPLAFTVQFDLPTACTGYDLSWGDGSSHISQNDGGGSCAQTTTTVSQSHTYTTSGTYTLTLKRGPSLGRTDTIGVTVSQ